MLEYETLKSVRVIDDHRVAVVFDGGSTGIFDCAPYFGQSYWKKLNDPTFFKSAYVEYGHLTWPGDIDISPIEVWQDAKRENVV